MKIPFAASQKRGGDKGVRGRGRVASRPAKRQAPSLRGGKNLTTNFFYKDLIEVVAIRA